MLEYNLCPRLAIPLPQEMIQDVYDSNWDVIKLEAGETCGEFNALLPLYPYEKYETLRQVQAAGPFAVNKNTTVGFMPVQIKPQLKETFKQVLIKILSFQVQENTIVIDQQFGGLQSLDDLGEPDFFVHYSEYQQKRMEIEKLLYDHDEYD